MKIGYFNSKEIKKQKIDAMIFLLNGKKHFHKKTASNKQRNLKLQKLSLKKLKHIKKPEDINSKIKTKRKSHFLNQLSYLRMKWTRLKKKN